MDDFIGSGGYNSNKPTQEQVNAKKWMKVIGVILAVLLLIVIALVVLMYYMETTELKISIDTKSNTNLKNVLIFDQGKVYIPIRAFASYVGYESNNAEYENKYTEDKTKCYVESTNEIASFSLGSNKIYKILASSKNDYEYFEIDEPVKMINDQLCTTIEGAQIAFNISMSYNQKENRVTIYTLPYLVDYYTAKFQNSGISDNEADFSNQKALLYNMIVVKNTSGNYGVQSLNGQEILGTKYAKIKFIESTKEFIVTTVENKMGIMSYDAKTKISPEYENIKQIDKDSELYLVTNNKKQGVINSNGSIIVYLEYDQIGIDSTKFASDKIKNQYLLYNKCIPAKKNGVWDLFDITGKKITNNEYTDLGCIVGNEKLTEKNANNLLLVPDYEGIVVRKNNVYGLIDSSGKQLLPISLQAMYSTTSEGKETYHMIYNNQEMNVIDYIKKYVKNENSSTNTDQNTNQQPTQNTTVVDNTQTNTNTTTTQTSTNTVNTTNSQTNTKPVNVTTVQQ